MNGKSKRRSTSSSANTEHVHPDVERTVAKQLCERDHLFFTRYFFKHRQGIKFRVNWHHVLIADVIQRVIDGTTKNVVINVSPGSSKTEMVVINLISRGLALNPWARFLHISYSDDLALLNSETAREVVESDEYQEKWPYAIAADAKSKKRWNVVVNGKKAGGVYAVSLAGQITGFRAGHMAEGWQGAIIIDDLEASFFTQEQMHLIQRFVSERGGALLMLGGQECYQAGGYDHTPVGSMLPVYLDRTSTTGPMLDARFNLTREGWLEPWMRLRTDRVEDEKRLASMPAFFSINQTFSIKVTMPF